MLTDYQKGSIFGAVIVAVAFAASFSMVPRQQSNPSSKPPAEIEGHQKQEKSFWEAYSYDPIAVFTSVLALIAGAQAVLFLWQLKYIRDGLTDANESAKAAKRSADAAIAIELPVIRAAPSGLSYGLTRDVSGNERHICSVDDLTFSNGGRTKCFPIEVQTGFTVGERLPVSPLYTSPENLTSTKSLTRIKLYRFSFVSVRLTFLPTFTT